MKTNIIIPVANTNDKCTSYLLGLMRSLSYGLYFDKSTEWSVTCCFDSCDEEYIFFFQKNYPDFKILVNSKNRIGFTANVNRGLRYAFKEYRGNFLILNMDTVLPHSSYLKDMVVGEGLMGPRQVDILDNCPCIHHDIMALNRECVTHINPPEYQEVDRITGFCMYINREVIAKIGFLDELFKAGFDDDDYCARARLAGFPVEVANAVAVQHYLKGREDASNTGAYTLETLGDSLKSFRLKWGIPNSIEHKDFSNFIHNNHIWKDTMKCH